MRLSVVGRMLPVVQVRAYGGFMGGVQQTTVEAEGVGVVLSGTPESIRMTLDDAIRGQQTSCWLLTASGELVQLTVRDERGVVDWKVRGCAW